MALVTPGCMLTGIGFTAGSSSESEDVDSAPGQACASLTTVQSNITGDVRAIVPDGNRGSDVDGATPVDSTAPLSASFRSDSPGATDTRAADAVSAANEPPFPLPADASSTTLVLPEQVKVHHVSAMERSSFLVLLRDLGKRGLLKTAGPEVRGRVCHGRVLAC